MLVELIGAVNGQVIDRKKFRLRPPPEPLIDPESLPPPEPEPVAPVPVTPEPEPELNHFTPEQYAQLKTLFPEQRRRR